VSLGIEENLWLLRHATALRLIPRGLSDTTTSRLNSKNYEGAHTLADQLQANIKGSGRQFALQNPNLQTLHAEWPLR
jgi:hypothetical protein